MTCALPYAWKRRVSLESFTWRKDAMFIKTLDVFQNLTDDVISLQKGQLGLFDKDNIITRSKFPLSVQISYLK